MNSILRFERTTIISLSTLVLILPIMGGCGGGGKGKRVTGRVDGTVTFNGQPVKGGSVSFVSKTTGDGAGATIEPSGKFKVTDPVPVGQYSAMVLPVVLTPDEIADGKQPPPSNDIPEQYRSTETSGLNFEVKEGQNTFEIKMTPPQSP